MSSDTDSKLNATNVDLLLRGIIDLARSHVATDQFMASAMQALGQLHGTRAVAIWRIVDDQFRLISDIGLSALGIQSDPGLQNLHEESLSCLRASSDETTGVATDGSSIERQLHGLRFRFYTTQHQPLTKLVLEIVTESTVIGPGGVGPGGVDTEPERQRLYASAIELMQFHESEQHRHRLENAVTSFEHLTPLLERIYAQTSSLHTAYEIANEGRRFLGCDRVWVFRFRGGRAEMVAASGVDRIDSQSRQTRTLAELAQSVALTGREFVFSLASTTQQQLPPQQETLLQHYLDTSTCMQLQIYPWRALEVNNVSTPQALNSSASTEQVNNSCIGGVVLEYFTGQKTDHPQRVNLFKQHAARAYAKAIEIEMTPFFAWGRRLQRASRFTQSLFTGRALVAGVALTTVLIALLVPVDLTVQAKGRYHPGTIQHIYAPLNGEVIRYHRGNRDVQQGETLIVVRSREWELRREEVVTQRGVTLEKLRGIESARLNTRRTPGFEANSNGIDWSATERELRELLTNQDQQLEIIDRVLEQLTISSPLTGAIVSWNPLESWEGRPVQQGQRLMSLASNNGRGLLELRIQDTDVRHLVNFQSRSTAPLQVVFAIASDPGRRYVAYLSEIGTITESLPGDGPTIRAIADVDSSELVDTPDGTTTVAYLRCGRTSLGYAWTRRLWDYLKLHWLP